MGGEPPGLSKPVLAALSSQSAGSVQNIGQALFFPPLPEDFFMENIIHPSLLVGIRSTGANTNYLAAPNVVISPNGEIALRVTEQGAPLTYSDPAQVSVGAASTSIIAANPLRRYLVLCNLDSAKRVSLNMKGAAAVLDNGITLQPYQSITLREGDGLTLAEIRGIASVASATVSVQEGV